MHSELTIQAMTLEAAAKRIEGVNARRLRRWIKAGDLAGHKFKGRWYVTPGALGACFPCDAELCVSRREPTQAEIDAEQVEAEAALA